ncbi:MAG: MBL fold metallo-hydrolase [Blautia sp.]|jgi:ribonuclease BN (tRNA processing enzyme)
MKIRMYNVGFGDCFCLRDKDSHLLVDFGSSNRLIGKKTRNKVFDEIISDLTTIENKNLLLTHFHLDHLSGLLYMMKKNYLHEFETVYLPDVFSGAEMDSALALLLLADLLKDSYLPSHQVSLFALVEALCRHPGKVSLLRRGVEFEGRYQTLWPDTNEIGREIAAVIAVIPKRHMAAFSQLVQFAGQLRKLVYAMTVEGGVLDHSRGETHIGGLEKDFIELRRSIGFAQLLGDFEERKIELRHLKNKISIVFQNAGERERSLLFTGDVPPNYLKKIAENYDGRYPLYDRYWCIKVPHHGTGGYYYDFREYAPENLLISNGRYCSKEHKKSKGYQISINYTGWLGCSGATMRCSNSDCCDGYANGCTCKDPDIIAPELYREI